MPSIPYPDTFPVQDVQTLITAVRTQSVPVADTVRAGWVVVGFGLGQILPPSAEPWPPRVGRREPLSAEQLADQLQAAVGQCLLATAGPVPEFALDWRMVVLAILALVEQLIQRGGK